MLIAAFRPFGFLYAPTSSVPLGPTAYFNLSGQPLQHFDDQPLLGTSSPYLILGDARKWPLDSVPPCLMITVYELFAPKAYTGNPLCIVKSQILMQKVKHESDWFRDPCIGHTEIKLIDLLAKCTLGLEHATLYLSSSGNGAVVSTKTIILHLDVVDEMMGVVIGLARTFITGDLYQALAALIGKLDAFRQAMDILSEIHPLLTVAWRLASGLCSAFQNVCKTDRRIVDLVRKMDGAFAFVHDVQALPHKAVSLQQTITGLLKQTIECCLFASGYAKRSFFDACSCSNIHSFSEIFRPERMLDISSNEKIDEFERSLADLKQQIESGVILQTAIVSMRTPGAIDELGLPSLLTCSRCWLSRSYQCYVSGSNRVFRTHSAGLHAFPTLART
ncbi:hypothetical protein ACEPAF_2061 [Sanghuangporus sanghuang]